MRDFNIKHPNQEIRQAVVNKINNLNKPLGSMGRLEDIALQVCLAQQSLAPSLASPCHILYGADHGIECEGVSVSPRCVTWQQMINFSKGGGGVNMFCRQHGFKLLLVDVGVDFDLSGYAGILDRKIAHGTNNFLHGPAMTVEQFDKALSVGVEMVDLCLTEGCRVISLGEMGIGNTSPSSVWMHLLGGVPLVECVGAGAGLNAAGVQHKLNILSYAVDNFISSATDKDKPETVMRWFGGFEMIAAIGSIMRAAEKGLLILIDGFIMTACAMAASRIYPAILDYMIFGHQGDESGHRRMLELIGVRPLLNLSLRLGEGTGALCSFPIVDSAVRMVNEMNSFRGAKVTKYF